MVSKDEKARGMTRRGVLGAAAAAGVAAATPGSAWASVMPTGSSSARSADVIVVGAGLAGLNAAIALQNAGRSVIVVEARGRVGGRNYDLPLGNGNVIEMGGEFIGPGQTAVADLAKSLGLSVFDAYSTGNSLYYDGKGNLSSYSGVFPPVSAAAQAEILEILLRVNNLAKGVSGTTPWTAANAATFDRQTIASWLAANTVLGETFDVINSAMIDVYGEDPSQVSMLDLLQSVTGVGGSILTLTGSDQSQRIVGGPQQMSKLLASRLANPVVLNSPVRAITRGTPAVVHTDACSFTGSSVIVAVPSAVVSRILFDPDLPPAYSQLYQRQGAGATVKINAVYPTPFWRAKGLSGSVVSLSGPINNMFDNSPPDASVGVLLGFAGGNFGRSLFGLTPATRKAAVLASLTTYFGPAAANPIRYEDLVWPAEPYSGGAYESINGPGVLTSLGAATDGPVGNIHFAGADLNVLWQGNMEAAIRSGRAAASEILAAGS